MAHPAQAEAEAAEGRKQNQDTGQERGQAHLPDHELTRVAVRFSLKDFQGEGEGLVKESQGWEGGLAPAL